MFILPFKCKEKSFIYQNKCNFSSFKESAEIELFLAKNNLNIIEASSLFSIFTHYNRLYKDFGPILQDLIENKS